MADRDLVETAPSGSVTPAEGVRIQAPSRYVLLERIGEGGMGQVWAAYDRTLDRKVAYKILHDHLLGHAHQQRLMREARAMARLSHPNVVPVYDVGEATGRTFLTMEFVAGRPLDRWLDEPRDWRAIAALFAAVAAGLGAAHDAGVIHRDVKPSNILVGDDGRPRVADFGVARDQPSLPGGPGGATGIAGSPAYMAPEQLRGEAADGRSDQFGLCASLYEALHGRRPFGGDDLEQLEAAIAAGPPAPVADVPGWLDAVVRARPGRRRRRSVPVDGVPGRRAGRAADGARAGERR